MAQVPAIVRTKRPVKKVFVHCSASDRPEHDDVSVMRAWHKARGWSDVGYHFFIKKDGTIQVGRALETVPAAQEGNNTGSIAICCHGLAKDKFTKAQFDSLRALCKAINAVWDNKLTFHGHREVAAKECPVFDYKAVLGLDKAGKLFAVTPTL